MKEAKKDLFSCISDPEVDAICVTTNGHYTTEGLAVMGGGSAGECAKRWPETAVRLGKCLKNFGTNTPFVIGAVNNEGEYVVPKLKLMKEGKYSCLIFSFPTIDNLMDGAKLELIQKSAEEMKVWADRFELKGIVVGRPGSGIGGLDWHKEVKPVLEKILDDRFTVVSFNHEE